MYNGVLYVALLLCTILLGGATWYNCMIPLLLFFVCLIKDKRNISGNVNTLIPIVLLVTGFISIVLTQGDKQNALYEYEQILCFILAFFVGLGIKDEDNIFKYVLVCATATAGVGLLSYCNLIRIEDFTFNDRYLLRLQSFLKYANTTAVLLGCGYFSSLKLFDTYQKKGLTYISSCTLIAFYLTVSKAAIPLFIVFGTLLFVVQRKYTRCFVLQNVVCMIGTLLIILAGFKQYQTVKILLVIITVLIGGGIVQSEMLKKILPDKRLMIVWLIGFGVFLSLGCLLLVSRDINIFETLFKRFDYMSDAFVLLRQYWLTGIGPGAWKFYQYSVQTTQYSVTEIHNSWLQIWLEFGIIFFVTIFASFIKTTVYCIRRKMYVYAAIILFILTHSLVDINLSFGIILMISGLIIGFALRDAKEIRFGKPIVCGTLTLCLVLFGYMICECTVRSLFEQAYLKKNYDRAITYSTVLEKICPYDSNLQISIAALTHNDTEQRIVRAIALSPLDPSLLQTDIEYSIAQKNPSVLEKIDRLTQMAKHQESIYAKAKEYLIQALERKICTRKEYDEYLSKIENQRNQYGVIDRNNLLEEIVKDQEGDLLK